MDKKRIIFFGFGIMIILALIDWAGAKGIADILKTADWKYLLLAVFVYVLTIIALALRWKVLLSAIEINAPFRKVFKAVFVGMFFNNISPGAKGLGEFIRVYYLAKETKKPYGGITASVMMDRILDLVPVGFMMVAATLHTYSLGEKALTVLIVLLDLVMIGFTFLVISVLMSEEKADKVVWWIYRFYKKISPSGARQHLDGFKKIIEVTIPRFQGDFKKLERAKGGTTLAIGYSFAYWLLTIARYYLVFLAVGYPLSPQDITVVLVVGMVVGMFAIIPGGAGIVEAVNTAVFISLGINPELAVTGVLIERLISFWGPTLVGSFTVAELGSGEEMPLPAPDVSVLEEDGG